MPREFQKSNELKRSFTVEFFCRVIDNFGDIGVAYRLARTLKDLRPHWIFRLTVDNLEAFKALEPSIRLDLEIQRVQGIEVQRWQEKRGQNTPSPDVVIENFGCGWPAGLNSVLFDPQNLQKRLIINVDYLSAEDYAQEYHKIPSLTPLPQVKKFFFMPGFTKETGGLLLGKTSPAPLLHHEALEVNRENWANLAGLKFHSGETEGFWLSLFTYQHNFSPLVASLASLKPPCLVLVPPGPGAPDFFQAWDEAGRPFHATSIPFQPQETYDKFINLCDLNLVRGEESLVRACVSGKPFLWHAYPQEQGYQGVKVEALLRRMQPFFSELSWSGVKYLFLAFNQTSLNLHKPESEEELEPLFENWKDVQSGFLAFAQDLWAQGDLGKNIVDFIEEPGRL